MTPSIDRTLHQFLTVTDLDLLPNLTFYLIMRCFHRTFATGAACQQRTLTPPDTWSCPTLGLACVLMSRPIFLNLSCLRTFEFRTSLGTSLLLRSCNLTNRFDYESLYALVEDLRIIMCGKGLAPSNLIANFSNRINENC